MNSESYSFYLKTLKNSAFSGDIHTDLATRLCMATDNSIYQVLPEAVLFPKSAADIQVIFLLAHEQRFRHLKFTPRGGGTGTNGQSLSPGIIIDCSRYLNHILKINLSEQWVEVEPGVILDQLNLALKSHGVFFAPEVSTSNRATLGGMVSTDASGQGSARYGKTSEHILQISGVLTDGSFFSSEEINAEKLSYLCQQDGYLGNIYQCVNHITQTKQALITEQFPKLGRFMTGYNLAKAFDAKSEKFNLNYIISGSEGTLCTITRLRLKLTPLPQKTLLVIVNYSDFFAALNSGCALLSCQPTAIETVDDKIIHLAKEDESYNTLKIFIHPQSQALNLIELSRNDAEEFQTILATHQGVLSYHLITDEHDKQALWEMRKRAVGLLGSLPGNRRPLPFVEDTVVPPQHLAAYIHEFCQILDNYSLQYGMFGHCDAGCIHVRPALDMTDPNDAKLIKIITEEVTQLVKKYHGVLWGEHGKGFRSCHTETFFGEELYQDLRRIKAAFDPFNQLNPGKIATPFGSEEETVSVDHFFRGESDRQIPASLREDFPGPLFCNGNGLCFNVHVEDVMCPSYKATSDRIHSPKGRATVMREWLRQKSIANTFPLKRENFWKRCWNFIFFKDDFADEVYAAMHGCLNCKACATSCPVKVDVPTFKSKFLYDYYQQYRRSLRDVMMAHSEKLFSFQSRHAFLFNSLNYSRIVRFITKYLFNIVDPPRLSYPSLQSQIKFTDVEMLSNLSSEERERSVLIVQDPFTSYFEAELVLVAVECLEKLGFKAYVLPIKENGKGLHVLGYLDKFKSVATKTSEYLEKVAKLNMPMIGLDASTVLCYRGEYKQVLPQQEFSFEVKLIQEFLSLQLNHLQISARRDSAATYYLLSHCTEKSLQQQTAKLWEDIFKKFNLELKNIAVGCCGMAGLYGHEREHQQTSKDIYALSWEKIITTYSHEQLLVTGYSCRSQVGRMNGVRLRHPIEVLKTVIGNQKRK